MTCSVQWRSGRSAGVRLVALDVDGTVLTPAHTIAASTSNAVAAARAGGMTVVLASSRSPRGLRPIADRLGLTDQWFVAFQGAFVARWAGTQNLDVLTETRLDPDMARDIEAQATAVGLTVGRYAGTQWQVPLMNAAIRREARITGEQPALRPTSSLDPSEAPHKLLIIAGDGTPDDALADFAAALPTDITATFSHHDYLEVTAAGVDKAHGLRALASHLHIALEESAAIGDGLNDLGLFAAVGIAVAMGQAPDVVKSAATYVTADNNTDGVAAALAILNHRWLRRTSHGRSPQAPPKEHPEEEPR